MGELEGAGSPPPPPKPTLPHPLVYAYVIQNFINILIFTVIASYYGDNSYWTINCESNLPGLFAASLSSHDNAGAQLGAVQFLQVAI